MVVIKYFILLLFSLLSQNITATEWRINAVTINSTANGLQVSAKYIL
ncbi:hypothetical protein MNBD_GAMMA03-552, partial [hydrothermal vent metagenome]